MMQTCTRNHATARGPVLMEHFLATMPHLSGKSCAEYRYRLSTFLGYLPGAFEDARALPASLDQDVITRYLSDMRSQWAFITVLSRARIVHSFLSFLQQYGYLMENPLERLRSTYPRKGLKGIVLALTGPSAPHTFASLRAPQRFASPLGRSMEAFLRWGRAHARAYQTEERLLSRFDRFLRTYAEPPQKLSDSILRDWLSVFAHAQPAHRYKSFIVVRRFCQYLRRSDPTAYVPEVHLRPCAPTPPVPHVYSHAQIVALLREAQTLKPSRSSPLRGEMFSCFIALAYTTGMRLSELLTLKVGDIDWHDRTLGVRETKFGKSRLVPLSGSTAKRLHTYLQRSRRVGLSTHPGAFVFQHALHHGPYSKAAIEGPFRELLRRLGLKPARGRRGPRIHDLRHTFAVHRLEQWYRAGEDVPSKLGLLSTYLGHVKLASTQRYLTMTPELLDQACQRFRQYVTHTESHSRSVTP